MSEKTMRYTLATGVISVTFAGYMLFGGELQAQTTADKAISVAMVFEDIPPYNQLPLAIRSQLQGLDLIIHIYSDKEEARRVFISGKQFTEGEQSERGFIVEKIDSAGVILSFKGQYFTLEK